MIEIHSLGILEFDFKDKFGILKECLSLKHFPEKYFSNQLGITTTRDFNEFNINGLKKTNEVSILGIIPILHFFLFLVKLKIKKNRFFLYFQRLIKNIIGED